MPGGIGEPRCALAGQGPALPADDPGLARQPRLASTEAIRCRPAWPAFG